MSVDDSVCVKKQKISRRYAIDADVVDLNNAVANLKFGVLTIKASKKPKPNQVRVNVTEDDEGDTSAALTSMMSMQPNMSVATGNSVSRPVAQNAQSVLSPDNFLLR
jgi:hypothetical protein